MSPRGVPALAAGLAAATAQAAAPTQAVLDAHLVAFGGLPAWTRGRGGN